MAFIDGFGFSLLCVCDSKAQPTLPSTSTYRESPLNLAKQHFFYFSPELAFDVQVIVLRSSPSF
jgi:hypothetical protein